MSFAALRAQTWRRRGPWRSRVDAYEEPQRMLFTPADLGLRAWYDAELGQPRGVGYAQLDGSSGDYITTPDAPNLRIAGDIEVVMRVKCNDWSAGVNQTLIGRYVTTGNQRSFRFYVGGTGLVVLTASPDGTAVTSATITPSVALVDGVWTWIRLRLQLTNGANSVATLETAADQAQEPTSWTANGTQTAATIANVFAGTAPLEIGTFANGTLERFSGQVSRCIVRDGFGGRTIADFNADACYGPGYLNEGALPTAGGSAYVPLRGVSGDYVWTADKPALRVTGDLEVVARVASATWSSNENFVTRWGAAGAQAFAFQSISSTVRFFISTDGTNALGAQATANHGFTAGSTYWVKVTRRASDGRVQFFTAPDSAAEPSSWTQLGADVTLSAGSSIFAAATALELGSQQGGTVTRLTGGVFRAIVRNGIGGTTVADFNAANATAFGLPSDGYGNGWLIADPKHHGNWTVALPKIYDRSGNGVAPATFGAGSNQPLWLPWKGASGVFITPSSSNRLNTPSAAAFDVTDLDVWVDITMPDWTPSGETTIAARKDPSDPNQAWRLTVTGSGAVTLRWYPLGTSASLVTRTSAVTLGQCGVVDGQRVAIRALLDVDNGAGGYTVTMQLRHGGYDGTWVTFDSFTGGAATALPSVNRVLEFGNEGGNGDVIVHRGVLNGSIGGAPVADFVAASCGQAGYTDTLGRVWTIGRATSGRKAVVQSPVANSARSVILHGTDDYITLPLAAIPAMGIADNASVATVMREWATPISFGIWWSTQLNTNASAGVYVANNGTAYVPYASQRDAGGNVATVGVLASAQPTGSRVVHTLRMAGRGAAASDIYINGVGPQNSAPDTSAVGDASASASAPRIGSTVAGGNYVDAEFEAWASVGRVMATTEHGQFAAYYRGGL